MKQFLLGIWLTIGTWLGWGEGKKLYRVERVIDGDTIVLESKQIVRLATIDAPEEGFCGFEESKKSLSGLVAGKNVRVEGKINDDAGRLLATVYVNQKVVNEEMAKLGWARYTQQESAEREKIKKAGEEARAKKWGVYGMCVEESNPQNPSCKVKGNNREGRKTYMYPGCGTYSSVKIERDVGDEWFCTTGEAEKAGYTRAGNCH